MATLTKDQEGTGPNPGDETPADTDAPPRTAIVKSPPKYPEPPRKPPGGGAVASGGGSSRSRGFFTIYKKGQGKWTRMGTVAGAVLIGALTLDFIYSERQQFHMKDNVAYIACAIFAAAYSLLVYFLMNKPTHADFLIATDSEMKKVNWTSKKELIGSTKVVILFMFVVAIFLFVIDILFGYFFYMIHVLKTPPL